MRKRRDGTPTRRPDRRKLTPLLVSRLRPEARVVCIWDTQQKGLLLRVQPTGPRAYKCPYRQYGRPRWYHIGDERAVSLADARKIAAEVMLEAIRGGDPAADRR